MYTRNEEPCVFEKRNKEIDDYLVGFKIISIIVEKF